MMKTTSLQTILLFNQLLLAIAIAIAIAAPILALSKLKLKPMIDLKSQFSIIQHLEHGTSSHIIMYFNSTQASIIKTAAIQRF
jgi:hypothetical protein